MPKSRRYSNKQVKLAIEESFSIRSVLIKLGLCPTGGNYKSIQKLIKKLDLDTSHFTGKGHLRGKTHNWTPRKPIEELLVKDSFYQTSSLRRRLIREQVLEYKCDICGNKGIWLGKSLSLQLDHINGINTDHRLKNLRYLCPNCHVQTPTHGSKNIVYNSSPSEN